MKSHTVSGTHGTKNEGRLTWEVEDRAVGQGVASLGREGLASSSVYWLMEQRLLRVPWHGLEALDLKDASKVTFVT